MLFLVSALMVPEEVTIIPNFFLIKWMGLMDTHWPLILLPTFGPHGVMATFLMRQYFLALPKELEEAGKMDGLSRSASGGASRCRCRARRLRPSRSSPSCSPGTCSLSRSIFLSSLDMFTLPLALSNFTDTYGLPLWNLQLAATTPCRRADPGRLPDRAAADHGKLRALRRQRLIRRKSMTASPSRT